MWEVVRSLRGAKTAQPDLTDNHRISLVATNAGLTVAQVQAAIGYYTAYPEAVDHLVHEADDAEEAALAAWERRTALLS